MKAKYRMSYLESVEARAASVKKYQEAHLEELKIYRQNYYQQNKEKIRKYNKEMKKDYYEKNKEKIKAYSLNRYYTVVKKKKDE